MSGTSQRRESAISVGVLLDNVPDPHLLLDEQFTCIYSNSAACERLSHNNRSLCQRSIQQLAEAFGAQALEAECARVAAGEPSSTFEFCQSRSDTWFEATISQAGQSQLLISFRDISGRKEAEAQLARSKALLELAEQTAAFGAFEWDPVDGGIRSSPELDSLYRMDQSAQDATAWLDRVVPGDREGLKAAVAKALADRELALEYAFHIQRPGQAVQRVRARAMMEYGRDGSPVRVHGICAADAAVDTAMPAYNQPGLAFVQSAARFGIWDWNLETDSRAWSPELFRLFRLDERSVESSFSEWLAAVHPDDRERSEAAARQAASQRQHLDIEYRTVDGRVLACIGDVFVDPATQTPHMVGIDIDITWLKDIGQNLRLANEDLRRSNEDLQRFAFVASHDLQEPLRMISTFTQMLIRRNADKLDEESVGLVHFVQQGTDRMRGLITGLLDYSQLSKDRSGRKVRIGMDALLSLARMHLAPMVAATGAVITFDPLPILWVDDDRLLRVFQNLLSNAIKYRSAETPRIHVSARCDGGEHTFSVSDNGTGFEMKYAEQIFGAFERLHTRTDIEGAGLGLSIVKRIVEGHGGRVWAESQPGAGTTFYFTLPAKEDD